MKQTKLAPPLFAIALLTVSVGSQAMEIKHTDADLNGDGVVTEAEIINVVQNHFFSMDTDGTGGLSAEEWAILEPDGEGR